MTERPDNVSSLSPSAANRLRVVKTLSRPVRGLLFDAGDVLYDATVWRRWLLRLLGRMGLHTNYRAFFYLWDRDYLDDVHRGRHDFCEAFEAFLLAVGLTHAQIDEVQAACQAKRNEWEATARPLPGVKTTLARLRAAGLVLGVLSDCEYPGTVLQHRLERFGLEGLFTAFVSSLDLKRTKPDPFCYLSALRAMNVAPEEAAFVGHDTEELAGAWRAGMQTIAFNFDPDACADVFIGRFEELLEVVQIRGIRAAG